MISDARYSRVLARRETYRSRSVAVSVVLALIALGLAYVGTECVLAALRMPALLVSPADALSFWRAQSPVLLAAAGVVAVLGIIVLIVAIVPSRRPRHRVQDGRSVVLVDDDVLASAISQSVARRTGIASGQARTAIGRRSALVSVTPTSGRLLSSDEVREHAAGLVDSLELTPRITTRASVADRGRVGS